MAIRRRVAKPSAFALEPLLDTSIVISFGSYLLSCVKLRVVLWCGDGGKIVLARSMPTTSDKAAGVGSGVSMVKETRREKRFWRGHTRVGAADLGPCWSQAT